MIVGHEIPALQGIAADLRRIRPGDVALEPHGRLFQADADQLHAVVGLDHHLGEVRLGRHAADGDHLHAEAVAQLVDDELFLARIRGRIADAAAELAQELLHLRQAFGRRIDRAVDERLLLHARRERPQGDDQVLQLQHRPARFDAQRATRRRFGPGLGRTGDHDVARFRIAEHVLQPREPGQVLHHIVDRLAVGEPLLDHALEPRERDLAQLAALGHVLVEPQRALLARVAGPGRRSDLER